jgi:predicted O-methyltransferase YrrM
VALGNLLFKKSVQHVLRFGGLSLHKRSSIEHLLNENAEFYRRLSKAPPQSGSEVDQECERLRSENAELRRRLNGPPTDASVSVHRADGSPHAAQLERECERLRTELRKHEELQIFYVTTEDYHAADKMRNIVDRIDDFGNTDFAELSCWLFASSLNDHRVIHQRVDEGSLLWRAVKMSGGPILEIGRAAGGSTLVLLGASGSRPVISIDREPFHAAIAEHVFSRSDVAPRLKLYRQTSREPIAETEFGMLFIDADHSYEGICHDIGTYWNTLKSFDGKPPLAAFHDAADNPVTFVEPVKHACEELLAEPGAARLVESWGAMLVLEKTGDIDQDRWYKKEHEAFWQQYADRDHPILRPTNIRTRLHPDRTIKLGSTNLLGDENVEHESWTKSGVEIDRAQLNVDNPLRLVRETAESGEHGVEKSAALNVSRLNFLAFLRPHRLETLRLSILHPDRSPIASVDVELGNCSRIGRTFTEAGVDLIDASFLYRNSYFACNLAVGLPAPLPAAVFSVKMLDPAGANEVYRGDGKRGFFINLSSVREIR